LLFYTGDF
jgi:hypothetical protein